MYFEDNTMNDILRHSLNQIAESADPIKTALKLAQSYLKCDLLSHPFIDAIYQHSQSFNNSNAYHNQYHFSEVIYGCAYLLQHEYPHNNQIDKYEHALVLITAAAFHDFDHNGQCNKTPYELEKLAVTGMKKFFEEHNIDDIKPYTNLSYTHFMELVEKIILHTEFNEGTIQAINNYKDHPNTQLHGIYINRLSLLLVESDVLLSSLHDYGFTKTTQICTENKQTVDEASTHTMWKRFVEKFSQHHYVSEASQSISMQQEIMQILVPVSVKPKLCP